MSRYHAAFLIVSALCPGVFDLAEAQTLTDSLVRLQKATLGLLEKEGREPTSPEQKQVEALARNVETLQTLADHGVEPGTESAYAKTLDFDARLLQRSRAALPLETLAIVDNVNRDLTLKIQVGEAGLGSGPVLKSQVHVRATTVNSQGNEVKGILLGLCNFQDEDGPPLFAFPAPTPTAANFTPGRYIVKEMQSTLVHQLVEIGLDGLPETDITIKIP
jgi:hypothetical protein